MREFVRMENICSPGVLRYAKINVMHGEIVGLLGLNNVGKTELMEILSGFSRCQQGSIYFDDVPVHFTSPLQANKMGIYYIFNEKSLLHDFTVMENIFIMQPRHAKGLIHNKQLILKCEQLLERIRIKEVGIKISAEDKIKNLNNLQKLAVQIAKAVSNQAKLIVIDHLLYEFPQVWIEILHEWFLLLINEINISFILTDCRPNSLTALCDRIFVLRDGMPAGSFDAKTTDESVLASVMTGFRVDETNKKTLRPNTSEKIFEFDNVVLPGKSNALSFDMRINETVGMCSLSGTFSDDLSDLLLGEIHAKTGNILLEGNVVQFTSSNDSIQYGIGIVSDKSSVFRNMDLADNVSVMALRKFGYKMGFINKPTTSFAVSEAISSWENPYLFFKKNIFFDKFLEKQIVISRSMAILPKVMIYLNLDKGLDNVNYHRILKQIQGTSDKPKSSLFVSSNIHNLLSVCTKIYFVRDGQVMHTVYPHETTYENILAYYKRFCDE